jgi:hypothetical protein
VALRRGTALSPSSRSYGVPLPRPPRPSPPPPPLPFPATAVLAPLVCACPRNPSSVLLLVASTAPLCLLPYLLPFPAMSCSFLSLSVSKPFSGILMQHEEEVSNRVPSHVQDDYIVFSLFLLKFFGKGRSSTCVQVPHDAMLCSGIRICNFWTL